MALCLPALGVSDTQQDRLQRDSSGPRLATACYVPGSLLSMSQAVARSESQVTLTRCPQACASVRLLLEVALVVSDLKPIVWPSCWAGLWAAGRALKWRVR